MRIALTYPLSTLCPTFRQLKSCRLHSLVVPSAEEVARTWSTGEKQTAQMPRRWPRNTPKRPKVPSPVKDHSLAVRSWEPDASSLSLGDIATLFTSWGNGNGGRCDKVYENSVNATLHKQLRQKHRKGTETVQSGLDWTDS